jgi:N-hydroxyarylamine O-acetyltransferase
VFDPAVVAAYLERLGLAPADVTVDRVGLTRLQRAHLWRIPFENLSIHLGEPISLDLAVIGDKLTFRRRGGFCYEMNGGFGALLQALGFPTTYLEGRVYGADGSPGIHFDHLCLRVDLDEPYLADVGFGASFVEPLRLETRAVQVDPAGEFQIVPTDGEDGWLDLVMNGRPQFRFSLQPRQLTDFQPGCTYHQTSPDSHFTQNSLCTLPNDDGRTTIAGRLLVERRGDERTEREVVDDAELLALYRERFGITLERLPPK